ncbi:type II and III secretion system protein family protein [Neomegalonema sp.]|uniref:type II and III secretion system protein family protein n=1 Tax=Neomegalonema sp. TaxID=2039713 RepID=UPI002604F05B|nr:type II and III secretion system protein family protein [Neomegalonema sp.]MDD2868842.1 type II and III secretion system protein family protein [Neomegalonema sp.]
MTLRVRILRRLSPAAVLSACALACAPALADAFKGSSSPVGFSSGVGGPVWDPGQSYLQSGPLETGSVPSSANYYLDQAEGRPGADMFSRMSGYGADMVQDGLYGPSMIEIGGEGAASQAGVVHVSKTALLKLPAPAREVVVADPGIASATLRTNRQILLYGLKVGQTNIFVFDENGAQILNLELRVEADLRTLEASLRANFPGANLRIESMLGQVILRGQASSLREAQEIRRFVRQGVAAINAAGGVQVKGEDVEIIDRMAVAGENQVMLKVRVAEMRREIVKQFGVNLGGKGGIGGAAQEITLSNPFNVNGLVGSGLAASLSATVADFTLSSLVRAFERHGVARLLAEPNLTAVSGESASFFAGGQFPYPVSIDERGNIGYDFRNFGVALDFTPVVLDNGRISLKISTEVSELTNEGALTTGAVTIPGIAIRRANTVIEAPSGGAIAIAGLIQQRDAGDHAGLPGIKNLPILGRLFSSSDFKRSETELVILVTPYLVRPNAPDAFVLPTDGFAPPSDADLYMLGRVQATYGAGPYDPAAARAALRAPLGFILN